MEMDKNGVTDEMLAAFIDGNATADEIRVILRAAKRDSRMRELLSLTAPDPSVLPMLAEAAAGARDNFCNIRCEQYVLEYFGISVPEEELVAKSTSEEWLKEGGTPLFRMGSLCAAYGLSVSRKYDATPENIREALRQGYQVIVAVDGGEIDGDEGAEALEDAVIGKIPDHALVVLSVDGRQVVCFNPYRDTEPQMISMDRFLDAWDDANGYMVKVNTREAVAKNYVPAPLDLSEVELPSSLRELTEAIAENTHECWSKGRLDEGWTYGPERNDALRKHPDLLPYSDLSEGEKEYDRVTAMNAIKLIVKLGYKIEKQ